MCGETKDEIPESEKLEYEQANEWWRTLSQLRRRDMGLFTAAQGAVVAIIKSNLLTMGVDSFVLSAIAFIIALIGLNNEIRLYTYLRTMRARAMKIEGRHRMGLLRSATAAVRDLRWTGRSSRVFAAYYTIIGAGWLLVWAINIWRACAHC